MGDSDIVNVYNVAQVHFLTSHIDSTTVLAWLCHPIHYDISSSWHVGLQKNV
jgi:hypothetical protein